jgi:hypothetical protein
VAYDNITSRTDAAALIPEEVSKEMLTNLQERAQGSAALKLFKRVPVGRAQVRFPVLSALPIAYWVTGDTGLKQTTEVNWANKYLNIEEIAVIVPVPDNVLDDSGADLVDQVQPLMRGGRRSDARRDRVLRHERPELRSRRTSSQRPSRRATRRRLAARTTAAALGGIVGDQSAMLAMRSRPTATTPLGGRAHRTLPRLGARQARNTQGDRFGEINVTKDNGRDRRRPVHVPDARPVAVGTGRRPRRSPIDQAEFVARCPQGHHLEAARPRRSSRTTPGRSSTTSPSRTWSRCG